MILEVGLKKKVKSPEGFEVFDFNDKYVLPGFIDIHVHGAVGHDTR